LLNGYDVDMQSPCYFRESPQKIFDVRKASLKTMTEFYNQMQLVQLMSSSEDKIETKLAAKMGFSASASAGGALVSASASAGVEASAEQTWTNTVKSVRMDTIVEMPVKKVMFTTLNFKDLVSDQFKACCSNPGY